jgi:tRNA-2-methylthio-N6-dimethylallyladenosine synthase
VKAARLELVQGAIQNGALSFDAAQIGKRLPVLFERKGRKSGQIGGRSPYLQAVHAEGPESLIGHIAEVDIVASGPNSLTGVIKSEFAWREPNQAAG